MSSTFKRKIVEVELEDTSELLRKDTEPLREVSNSLWWCIDFIFSFICTYLTHDDMSLVSRLYASTFVVACAISFQTIYFTAGLDRPMSGQAKIDKWWHMIIVHFSACYFFWQWCCALFAMQQNWVETDASYALIAVELALGTLLVLLLSDIIAGFVHWFGDSMEMYFFEYHHKDSRYMTRQSYVHHCWETYALGLLITYFVPGFFSYPLVSTLRLVSCQTNECHMWSHCLSSEIPPLIKILQDMSLVLSWKAHKDHHKAPHLVDYCVFNGWANPIMNKILPGFLTNEANKLRDTKGFQWIKKTLDT